MKTKLLFLLLIILISTNAYSDNYSFDVDEYAFNIEAFEQKKLEYSGNIEFHSVTAYSNNRSINFKLKNYNQNSKSITNNLYIIPELFFKYNGNSYNINLTGNFNVYTNSSDWEFDQTVYEAFYQKKFGNTSVEFGKRSIKWGKGYIWNSVNYAGRQKDPEDVDAVLEGYYMLNVETIKSLNHRYIDNIAINYIFIPSNKNINSRFDYPDTNTFISRFYALVNNSDIDFYLFANDNDQTKFGLDFSTNIKENWEVHFEYSRENKFNISYIDNTGNIKEQNLSGNNFLIGTRYLTLQDITVIFEYFHKFDGFTKKQINDYYTLAETALHNNADVMKYRQYNSLFNQQFISKDYLYLKLSKPDVFNILYFTPSIYTIYNIKDNSFNSTIELKYNGIENIELKARYAHLEGDPYSQYGEKASDHKFDFQIQYYY